MSTNTNIVELIVEDYAELVARQNSAPDWPYPGSSYAASESAADERWGFWQDLWQHYPEAVVEEAFQQCMT